MNARRLLVTGLMLGLPALVQAQVADRPPAPRGTMLEWGVYTGARYASNAPRLPNGESGSFILGGASITARTSTRRITADIDGNVGYELGQGSTVPSGAFGALNAMLRLNLIEERFDWFASNTWGQTLEDPLRATGTDNRGNANLFITGPDVTIPLGVFTGIRATGRYSDLSTGVDPSVAGPGIGERTTTASVSMFRRLTRSSQLDVTATAMHIDQKDPLAVDYDRYMILAGASRVRSRSSLAVNVGYVEVDVDGRKERAPMIETTFSRRMSSRFTLDLSGGRSVVSASDRFRRYIAGTDGEPVLPGAPPPTGAPTPRDAGGVAPTVADLATANPMTTTYARFGLNYSLTRTDLSLTGGASRERPTDVVPTAAIADRDLWDAGITFRRRIRPSLDLTLTGRFENRKFDQAVGTDRTTFGNLALRWQMARALQLTASYGYERRVSDFGFGYDDNSVYVGLSYGSVAGFARGTGARQ